MKSAPAPAGAPQGGKGQKEGGGKQGSGGDKEGGGKGGKGNSGPKNVASLSKWTEDTASTDGWLMMSFVVAWFAGDVGRGGRWAPAPMH